MLGKSKKVKLAPLDPSRNNPKVNTDNTIIFKTR